MQAKLVGNVAQHQRTHGQLAVHEKVLLPLDDGPRDAQDGVKALLDVLDEPARLLQALLQRLVAIAPLVATQGSGVNVVHAQTRHDVGVELHAELLTTAPDPGHQHVGHDGVALHVGKTAPGARLQPRNHRHGAACALFAGAAGLHESAHIAARQQFQRLLADAQRGVQHVGIGCAPMLQRLELQRQAFAQVARAHAGGLQALQQPQCHREAVHQFFGLLQIAARQARSQLVERVGQVAIVIQRFDEEAQRRPIHLGQTQRQCLAVQEVGQGFVDMRQLGRIGLAIAVVVVVARGGLATPFTIVRDQLGGSVAAPVGLIGKPCIFSIILRLTARWYCVFSY